ncbi:hypothetical protein ACFV06_21475 [Streptomyces sp. NPDC059618]|uniref:hypothetical protein n=1 Tax=Streptomyces sp. NPDC059618 TaxID=3346887 RepID=UPI0036C6EA23
MKRTLTIATTVLLAATLAACSDTKTDNGAAKARPAASEPSAATSKAVVKSKPLTASTAFDKISASVTTAKLGSTVTAENDPNDLLGRPNQYTSKVTFTDNRVAADDVSGTEKDAIERGGSIEVFSNEVDAKVRAQYIQTVTKGMPALAEYDYVQGTVLVRVSHYLTPKQASDYKAAAANLGQR